MLLLIFCSFLFVYHECPLEQQSFCATPGTQLGKSLNLCWLMWSEQAHDHKLGVARHDYRLVL